MAWIELHQSVRDHQKVIALADALDLPEPHVVGHLAYLWLWAIDNCEDGVLPGSPRIIARAAWWTGEAQAFVDALVDAGLVDRTGDDLVIHDWDDYAGKLIQQRASNRERQRRWRERQKSDNSHVTGDDKPANNNVTVTSPLRNPTTVPNPTVPNLTVPNPTKGSTPPTPPAAPDEPAPDLEAKPTPSKKPLPEHGPAQRLVKVWAELTGVVPANYGRAVKTASNLVKAGCDEPELRRRFAQISNDPWWVERGFSLSTIYDRLDQLRTAETVPKPRGSPANGDAVLNRFLELATEGPP